MEIKIKTRDLVMVLFGCLLVALIILIPYFQNCPNLTCPQYPNITYPDTQLIVYDYTSGLAIGRAVISIDCDMNLGDNVVEVTCGTPPLNLSRATEPMPISFKTTFMFNKSGDANEPQGD